MSAHFLTNLNSVSHSLFSFALHVWVGLKACELSGCTLLLFIEKYCLLQVIYSQLKLRFEIVKDIHAVSLK
jgi:hypothetical protein